MAQQIESREQAPCKTLKKLSAFTYVERIETSTSKDSKDQREERKQKGLTN